MMSTALGKINTLLSSKLAKLRETGVFKSERIIASRQGTRVILNDKREMINFCSNNYLGLSAHPAVIKKSIEMTTSRGSGVSSVRFICGTQDIHKELEQKISEFHQRESAIAYLSCFDANAGLFECLFGSEDAILSDELNHASIIHGIGLSKARQLEEKLKECRSDFNNIIIVTDGVFSMEGNVAPLREICDLAEKYSALTLVDDCHATGFLGSTGRGTEEYFDIMGRIDILNSTLGNALGGAAGGYTTSSHQVVDYLRQRSKPYLFSNSLPPSLVGSALAAFELIVKEPSLIAKLQQNTDLFRSKMSAAGFSLLGENHPICPIMMPDEATAMIFAEKLLGSLCHLHKDKKFFVTGLTYPVVPKDKPRIRVQLSASHTSEEIELLIQAFIDLSKEMGLIAS